MENRNSWGLLKIEKVDVQVQITILIFHTCIGVTINLEFENIANSSAAIYYQSFGLTFKIIKRFFKLILNQR